MSHIHKQIACSQTLYFLFKVRRARVIKNNPRVGGGGGGYWPPAQGGRGGEEENRYFSLSRSSLARSPMFSERTKRKIKQRLGTGYDQSKGTRDDNSLTVTLGFSK